MRNTATESPDRRGSIDVRIGLWRRGGRERVAPTPADVTSVITVLRKGCIHRLDELIGRDVALYQERQFLLETGVRCGV